MGRGSGLVVSPFASNLLTPVRVSIVTKFINRKDEDD